MREPRLSRFFFLLSLLVPVPGSTALSPVASGTRPPPAAGPAPATASDAAPASCRECTARFGRNAGGAGLPKCFWQVATGGGRRDAAQNLEALDRRQPGGPWAPFYLALVERLLADERAAEDLFRIAAGRFAARGDPLFEYLARSNLHQLLLNRDGFDEAGFEVPRAMMAARLSGRPSALAQAQVIAAHQLLYTGGDLEEAGRLLRAAAPSQGDFYDWLGQSGNLALATGDYQGARRFFAREAKLAHRDHNRFAEATALWGVCRSLTEQRNALPDEVSREEIARTAEQLFDVALDARNLRDAALAQWLLGELAPDPREAGGHFERCLKVAPRAQEKLLCQDALAGTLVRTEPERSRRLLLQTVTLAERQAQPELRAIALRERMRVSWASGSADRLADSWAALAAVEELRDEQPAAAGQIELFATWTDDFYWLSGRLLASVPARLPDADTAFAVVERLRARTLLDLLRRAGAAPLPPARIEVRLAAVNEALGRTERRRRDERLPAGERAHAATDGEHLRATAAALAAELAQARGVGAGAAARTAEGATRSEFATLAAVRQELAADEALLSFQIAPWQDWTGAFGGGSWLLVATRDAPARVYRLAELGREELRSAIGLLNGQIQARDGSEGGRAAELYRQLLGPALGALPPRIRRLVVVPDDDLYRLPFAALCGAAGRPGTPPLAARYEISLVPSATLWLLWRRRPPAAGPVPALIFADPADPLAVTRTQGLPPLPGARQEASETARALGQGSVLAVAEAASEAALKHADLGRFRILHLATHAVVNDRNPQSSFIRLAPGAGEDGLLSMAEVAGLRLGGQLVVLSACSTARGVVMRGEGSMSLARAFFQAGAGAVVSSLWPLEDRATEALFDRFYRHLGDGMTVAASLAAAQRDRIAAGAPAAAWAGLVVLGDGSRTPVPGGRRPYRTCAGAPAKWMAGAAAAVAGLAAAGLAATRWRRRSRGAAGTGA